VIEDVDFFRSCAAPEQADDLGVVVALHAGGVEEVGGGRWTPNQREAFAIDGRRHGQVPRVVNADRDRLVGAGSFDAIGIIRRHQHLRLLARRYEESQCRLDDGRICRRIDGHRQVLRSQGTVWTIFA